MAPTHLLADGDVLLYRGRSILARAIRAFDRSEVSHAGLYLGNGMVGEALGNGLTDRPFDESVAGNEWVSFRRLTSPPETMWPVLDRAGAYLQRCDRYAYEQLLLLAVLSLTRRLPANRILRWLVRRLLDAATKLLLELVPVRGEPMICSEFVYRCYDEADPSPNDPYTLLVAAWTADEVAGRVGSLVGGAPAAASSLVGAPPPRGRIEPGSLLAWWLEASVPAAGSASPTVRLALEEDVPALDRMVDRSVGGMPSAYAEMSLEALLEAYLDEAVRRPDSVPPKVPVLVGARPIGFASLHTADIYARVNRLLGTWRHVRDAARPTDALPGPETAAPPPAPIPLVGSVRDLTRDHDRVFEAVRPVADFVTPGDLFACANLGEVGRWVR